MHIFLEIRRIAVRLFGVASVVIALVLVVPTGVLAGAGVSPENQSQNPVDAGEVDEGTRGHVG